MAVWAFAIANSGEGVRQGGSAILGNPYGRPNQHYDSRIEWTIPVSGAGNDYQTSLDSRFKATGFWTPV